MKQKLKTMATVCMLFACMGLLPLQAQHINLAGEWLFATGDKPDYTERIQLPGSMLTNGKGDNVSTKTQWIGSLYDSSYFFNPYMEKYRVEGNIKFPFFLTPAKHYVGKAWYGKRVIIPKTWKKRRVSLHLERPHIETTVYINGKMVGKDSTLSVPHEFEITPYVLYGKENKIDILVYNGIENVCVGQDSHSVTDQTQGDWNGIVGDISLRSHPQNYITDVQVYPSVEDKNIRVEWYVSSTHKTSSSSRHEIAYSIDDKTYRKKKFAVDKNGRATFTIPMGDYLLLWDEFTPNLYTLTSVLEGDTVRTTFGMRDFTIQGRQFLINGHKTWIRGTVENCCFPMTGFPPADEASWIAIFRKCKEYGLNMMRFHSYCPPEAAFAAADKIGIYLQPEGPSWPNHGVKLRRGMTIDRYLMEETQRMVRAYGNHPSFCMLAAGNEPAGDWVAWAGDFVDWWKQTGDKRHVYCGASVGGGWAFDPKSEYHVKGGARGLNWTDNAPQSTDDYYPQIIRFTQKGKVPVTFDINEPYLSHEQGQWCAFPDLKERSLYTGAYKAGNFDIFADLLHDNGMASQAEKFLAASGKLQTLAYKYELERNLRTRDYAGFQLLGLNDYSGQGTALVGVLNVFWKEKGYCTAKDWTQFCAPVVPLAKFPKFVYSNNDTVEVSAEMYNAYKETLKNARTVYYIHDSERNEYAHGLLSQQDIEVGKNQPLGKVVFPLHRFDKPVKLTLTITCQPQNEVGCRIMNTWDFWVYPSSVDMPKAKDIHVTDTLDQKAKDVLLHGGKVLICAAGKVRYGNDVIQNYLPVFWNTSWFKMRPPHTTGAFIDTSHPLFKEFPSDNWSNLNWWELLNKAQVMNLKELPFDYQPAIQPIDTWHVSRKLGMMIEANILGGKLLMTTMDITNHLDHRIVARQMRKAILDYMTSPAFQPTITLDAKAVTNLFEKTAPKVDMYTQESPDELKPKLK